MTHYTLEQDQRNLHPTLKKQFNGSAKRTDKIWCWLGCWFIECADDWKVGESSATRFFLLMFNAELQPVNYILYVRILRIITSTGEQSGSPRERGSAGESTRKSTIETTMAGEFKRKRSRENMRERVQKTALEQALDRTLEITRENAKEKTWGNI